MWLSMANACSARTSGLQFSLWGANGYFTRPKPCLPPRSCRPSMISAFRLSTISSAAARFSGDADASLFVSVMGSNSVGYARRATGLDAPSTLLLANVLDCLLGKGGLMEKVNRGHARISWNVFDAKVCDEIVPCCIRMVFGYAAETRRQHVLHVKTRIG